MQKMHYSESWIDLNVRDINERSIKVNDFYTGKIILIRGTKNNQHIDLIQCCNGVNFSIVKENLVSYKKLAKSPSLKERINVFLNAVRELTFYYFIDQRLAELIMYGYDDEDE